MEQAKDCAKNYAWTSIYWARSYSQVVYSFHPGENILRFCLTKLSVIPLFSFYFSLNLADQLQSLTQYWKIFTKKQLAYYSFPDYLYCIVVRVLKFFSQRERQGRQHEIACCRSRDCDWKTRSRETKNQLGDTNQIFSFRWFFLLDSGDQSMPGKCVLCDAKICQGFSHARFLYRDQPARLDWLESGTNG